MQTDEARSLYARRRELSEPTFGILKDQLGARRFLLRGLANVRAEFTLIATAFNLRALHRVWTHSMACIQKMATTATRICPICSVPNHTPVMASEQQEIPLSTFLRQALSPVSTRNTGEPL